MIASLNFRLWHHITGKSLNIPVLAITGTNGKTTTKELLAAIMAKKLKVHYTQRQP